LFDELVDPGIEVGLGLGLNFRLGPPAWSPTCSILSNYRELVKPADAEKWFTIAPKTPANSIQAHQPKAAGVEAVAATA
jgi:hypothetical protein